MRSRSAAIPLAPAISLTACHHHESAYANNSNDVAIETAANSDQMSPSY